ncbi:HEAT repeat domain-containing protein [Listeria cossartiae subsp. cayugensis]|uniref:HEAT repeat domain-containing protein n=1 Tax=Listeria cossartiae TaxID=2838249 RepID=UPI0028807D0D|nr:HEAT repeat domain-containing protein [Listeria cossartiae]MDT0001166.1 HEAT repeat domain-containing protein [Listeria cossartiae subsp. cayugensis]MDT0009612.1 HEAT repeat domain-containing protein [Listeria cossartiae subsp. cayugensis]MDT0031196.1 HEAT repeat domain-containing protein [Listeria cossartiae subsp. cayugensis]MDT0039312.1 HEAT repeat domain-containing protein [Listeria cossartiae subsp. cayugensis]MDT0044909.1 HEAT repeat domain-containing protein [Listeria cossartiae subs
MLEEMKKILDEIKTITQQKPFDYETAEGLIAELNLEEAPLELEEILLASINDDDENARIFAYEYLYYFDSEAVFQAALIGTTDDNDLVQMCAIEILGNLAKIESLPYLEKALKANDPNVRCFAAESIGFVGTDEAKILLEKQLDKETDSFAKVGIYSSLYFLGEEAMLSNIIALLDDSYHLTVIRSLSVLEDCIDQANKEIILLSIEKLLKRDIPISVKEKAEIVLEKIKRE